MCRALEMRAGVILQEQSQLCSQEMEEKRGTIELDGVKRQYEEMPPQKSTNRLEMNGPCPATFVRPHWTLAMVRGAERAETQLLAPGMIQKYLSTLQA